jgi:hypothetical protein
MDFFSFQYGSIFNGNNNLHISIKSIYDKYEIDITKVRGLKEHKERTKGVLKEDQPGVKDKDKDKDNILNYKKNKNENSWFSGNFAAQGEELAAYRFQRNKEAQRKRSENSEGED